LILQYAGCAVGAKLLRGKLFKGDPTGERNGGERRTELSCSAPTSGGRLNKIATPCGDTGTIISCAPKGLTMNRSLL